MDEYEKQYIEASQLTYHGLQTIARSDKVLELSSLTLPEIDEIVKEIAKNVPAGNVPAIILENLLRLPTGKVPADVVRRDIALLFKGVEKSLKKNATYFAFYEAPAKILTAYQWMMRMTGRDSDDYFHEGTWQFYVDYALRDDTARHTCETHGFDTALTQNGIKLSPVDRLTALAMTAVFTLHQYHQLLENEWRERVHTDLLRQVTSERNQEYADYYARLYNLWEAKRPYSRGGDVEPHEDYPAYRRRKFDEFLSVALEGLPADLVAEWTKRVDDAEDDSLRYYIKQMTIRAYLEPTIYGELRKPIPLEQTKIGVIYRGHYYLIPSCGSTGLPVDVGTMRAQIAAIMADTPDKPPTRLQRIAQVKRSTLPDLYESIGTALRQELAGLRMAPIWLNADYRDENNVVRRTRHQSLALIRQGERGVGDHPLTIFDTGESLAFDLSHIFFDGIWGVSIAEIMTNEALAWAVYLSSLPVAAPARKRPYSPALYISEKDRAKIESLPRVLAEASAETAAVDVDAMLALRDVFKQRNDLLRMTVNDLLVLYRAVHSAVYRPLPELIEQLEALQKEDKTAEAAGKALAILQAGSTSNPAILIPIDATRRHPRDRVFPMTFEVPLANLELISKHQKTLAALYAFDRGSRNRPHDYTQFEKQRQAYFKMLAGYGAILDDAKQAALSGKNLSLNSIRLLANIPTSIQRQLDKIPGQIDAVNDQIKGREVFSNVGKVAPTSTLTRFITAKDDNERKELAWGVLTDAEGKMRITLRDFRPHVYFLQQAGRHDVANRIAAHQLDSYAAGLNRYVRELYLIAATSYQTRGELSLA